MVNKPRDHVYLLVTGADVDAIRAALPHGAVAERIEARLRDDTGADIEDIVAKLMGFQVCFACSIEEQDRNCWCWLAHKLGRRLQRLVDRAQGTREPGDHPAPQRDVKPRSLR